MKRLLLKRILPFVMAIIMLASICLPVGAFSVGSSAVDEDGTPYYTVEFKDGVLRVKLNPQRVYDLLADGDLTREELENFVPADVLAALEGGVSTDALLSLASEYLTVEELQELAGMLPDELLSKYFLNPEFVEKVITLDEVLAVMDFDALLAGVEDQEKFDRELNELLAPVLGDLLTESVQKKLLEDPTFMEAVLADAIDRLLAEHETEVMAVLPDLVTDRVVNSILSNENYKNALVNAVGDEIKTKVMASGDLRTKLTNYLATFIPEEGKEIAEDNPLKKLLENEEILAQVQAHPEWLMTHETVEYIFTHRKDVLTNDKLIEIFGEDAIRELVVKNDYAVVKELMKAEGLVDGLVEDSEFYTVASKVITGEIVDKLVASEGFSVTNYMTNSRLAELLAGKTLVLTNAVKSDVTPSKIQGFLGGYTAITAEALIDNGHLDFSKINISSLNLNVTTIYNDMTANEKSAVATAYGINEEYFENKFEELTPEQQQAVIDNGWDTLDEWLGNGLITIEEVARDKNITPQTLFEKYLIDVEAMLDKYPDSITREQLLANKDALKISDILNFSDYGIQLTDILNADLVDVSRVLSDSNITVSNLGLNGNELAAMAKDALEIDGVKELLQASFLEEVKKGSEEGIDPIDLFAHVDLTIVATSEEVDLSALIHELVDPKDTDSAEMAAIKKERIRNLSALVNLTASDYQEIFEEMEYKEIVDILTPHTSEIIEKTGIDPFLECFGAIELIDVLFATPEKSGMMVLISDGTLSFDQIAIAIGGVEKPNATEKEKKSAGLSILANKMDKGLVIKKLGDLLMEYVTFGQINELAGGYEEILEWYTTEELTAIVRKIGYKKLFALAKDSGLLTSPAAKDLAKTILTDVIADKAKLKSLAADIKQILLQIVVEEVGTVQINDAVVFKNGVMDVEAAVRAVLLSIPDVETFCEMEAGDVIVGMVLHTTFHNYGDLKLGFEICFDGDFSDLQRLAESQKDLFHLEVGEDDLDLHVSSVLPAKVMTLYARVLESDRLPVFLKGKLLELPAMTLPQAAEMLDTFSDEELAALADAVNEKLDAVLNKADGAMDKLPEGARSRVDAILEKLRTVDGWKKLADKAETLTERLPDRIKTISIYEMYDGAGHFTLPSASYSFDLSDKVSSKLSLPSGMLKADLSGSFSAEVTFKGLYSLTLDDRQGGEEVFLLPAGISLDVLESVSGLDLSLFGDRLPAVMPAMDTIVTPPLAEDEYEMVFMLRMPNGSESMLDTILYKESDTALPRAPRTPDGIRGYQVVWPDYNSLIGAAQYQTVYVTYEAIRYELRFQKGESITPVGFTVETIDRLTIPATDAPGHGYRYEWELDGTVCDLGWIKNYLKNPNNALDSLGVFVQVKVYEVYTVSFYEKDDRDNTPWHTASYTVEGWVSSNDYIPTNMPTAPEEHTAHVWWNVTDNEPFETTTDTFDFSMAKDLEIREIVSLTGYSFVFRYLDGTTPDETVYYTKDTAAADITLPQLTAPDLNGDFHYEWDFDGKTWEEFFRAHRFEENVIVLEEKVHTQYKVTLVHSDSSEEDDAVYFDSKTSWQTVLNKIREYMQDDTIAKTYSWLADMDGDGTFETPLEDITANPAKSFTLKEFWEYKTYTYTFYDINWNEIDTYTVSAETLKSDFIAWVNSKHTTPIEGKRHVWLTEDNEEWTPDQFVNGGADWLRDREFYEAERDIPQYIITFVPLKNNTSGVAADQSEWIENIVFYSNTTTLEGKFDLSALTLHTVVPGENDKLYKGYFWYVDRDGNSTYDAGEVIVDPAQFNADAWIAAADNGDAYPDYKVVVREYGDPYNYTLTLVRRAVQSTWARRSTPSVEQFTVTYNANNWPEVYEYLNSLLRTPEGDEVGSYDYAWYYQDVDGNLVKYEFPEQLTNANVESIHEISFTETRHVEDDNKLYIYDRNGNLFGQYYYSHAGFYERDAYGFDTSIDLNTILATWLVAEDYYDAGWFYAGNGDTPILTATGFDPATFLSDLGIDLETATKEERRINIQAVYEAHEYTLTFKDLNGQSMGEVVYTVDGIVSGTIPALPTEIGYTYTWRNALTTSAWEEINFHAPADLTIELCKTTNQYTLTFKDPNGQSMGDVVYTVEGIVSGTVPTLPTEVGYTYGWVNMATDAEWLDIDYTDPQSLTIQLRKTANQYKVTFYLSESVAEDRYYWINDKSFEIPSVTIPAGTRLQWYYMVGGQKTPWSKDALTVGDVDVFAEFIDLIYTVTFVGLGDTPQVIPMTKDTKTQPALPAQPFYTGAWYVQVGAEPSVTDPLWDGYSLVSGGTEITVYALYTEKSYRVDFVYPDGSTVSKTYTVSDTLVPADLPVDCEPGYEYRWYVGNVKWEDYQLTDTDATIRVETKKLPLEYTFIFTYPDGTVIERVGTVLNEPTAPAIEAGEAGYYGAWFVQTGDAPATNDPLLESYDIIKGGTTVKVYARILPTQYKVTFVIGDTKIVKVYTVLDPWTPVELPAKAGYHGAWFVVDGEGALIAWSEYVLKSGAVGVSVKAVYTPIEYTVTFKHPDGSEEVVTLTCESEKPIPEFKGKEEGFEYTWYVEMGENDVLWSDYVLVDHDAQSLTVYAQAKKSGTEEVPIVTEPEEPSGYGWIWWLLIPILILLILLILGYFFVIRARKLAAAVVAAASEDEDEEEEAVTEASAVEEPVIVVPVSEPEPEPETVVEVVDTVDVDTADAMMEDTTAMAVLETVDGGSAVGLKSIVNISQINEAFDADETVDMAALKAKKLIPAKTQRVKVLADGHLDKPLTVIADSFSVQAIKMITLTGGKAIQRKVSK